MKPQYEPQTREQFYGYLIEECGEVLQAAGKTLRWGEYRVNPEIATAATEPNYKWLRRELNDLRGAMDRLEKWMDECEDEFEEWEAGMKP